MNTSAATSTWKYGKYGWIFACGTAATMSLAGCQTEASMQSNSCCRGRGTPLALHSDQPAWVLRMRSLVYERITPSRSSLYLRTAVTRHQHLRLCFCHAVPPCCRHPLHIDCEHAAAWDHLRRRALSCSLTPPSTSSERDGCRSMPNLTQQPRRCRLAPPPLMLHSRLRQSEVDRGDPMVLCTSEYNSPESLLRTTTYSRWQSAVCSLQMGTHNANDVCQQKPLRDQASAVFRIRYRCCCSAIARVRQTHAATAEWLWEPSLQGRFTKPADCCAPVPKLYHCRLAANVQSIR